MQRVHILLVAFVFLPLYVTIHLSLKSEKKKRGWWAAVLRCDDFMLTRSVVGGSA